MILPKNNELKSVENRYYYIPQLEKKLYTIITYILLTVRCVIKVNNAFLIMPELCLNYLERMVFVTWDNGALLHHLCWFTKTHAYLLFQQKGWFTGV